jgi:hypothetical protein
MGSPIQELYNTFHSFQRLFAHIDTINDLGVMQFWSQPDFWKSGLIRFEQSEIFKLLSLDQVQSQKTSNIKLVANFINFPVIAYTLKSDK